MTPRALVLAAFFVPFVGFSAWVCATDGFVAILGVLFRDGPSAQVFLDLGMALGLVTAWIWHDARRRGVSPWPWLVGTLAFGSLAPFVYLILRETSGAPSPFAPPAPSPPAS